MASPATTQTVRPLDTPRFEAGFRHPLPTADGWTAPADDGAAAAAAYDLRELSTSDAPARPSAHGHTATAVPTDLCDLHHDVRSAGSISRDAHGAPAVPDPWSLA
ncbi:hypothetical protein ACFWUW_21785 [Streptomyces sp. NPDC058655]|uniref:hypothetical protein n=1 Tax=unclassified Streptomyces TaxID=2593676 RepID=UPI00364FD431